MDACPSIQITYVVSECISIGVMEAYAVFVIQAACVLHDDIAMARREELDAVTV